MTACFFKFICSSTTKTIYYFTILIVNFFFKKMKYTPSPLKTVQLGLVFLSYRPLVFRNLYRGFSSMPLIDKFLIPIPLLCNCAIRRLWLIKEFREFGTCLEADRGGFAGGHFFYYMLWQVLVEGSRASLSTLTRKVILFALISYPKGSFCFTCFQLHVVWVNISLTLFKKWSLEPFCLVVTFFEKKKIRSVLFQSKDSSSSQMLHCT